MWQKNVLILMNLQLAFYPDIFSIIFS